MGAKEAFATVQEAESAHWAQLDTRTNRRRALLLLLILILILLLPPVAVGGAEQD